MTKAFPEPAANPDSVIINPPPRFHTCPECDAQFSSTSRLLAHVQKNCSKSFTCKHCEKAFMSNNKLHEHVRLHDKIYDKTLEQRFAERKDSHINSSISSPTLSVTSTSPTTSRSMTASAEPSYLSISMTKAQAARSIEPPADPSATSMDSAEPVAPTSSRHHKLTCMSSTSPSSPPQTSMLKHQEQHRKSYLTMNDLFEMFAEKSSKRSMSTTQKRPTSPYSPEPRQTRIKSVDPQEGLKDSTMIAGKQSRKR